MFYSIFLMSYTPTGSLNPHHHSHESLTIKKQQLFIMKLWQSSIYRKSKGEMFTESCTDPGKEFFYWP